MNLASIAPLLTHYGYALIFLITIFEGPIVSVIAAFLASQGYFNLFLIYLLALGGDIVGDFIFYAFGRWNLGFVKRFGPWVGVTEKKILEAEKIFTNHQKKTLVLSKVIHGIGLAGIVAAGVLKVPYRKFFSICSSVSVIQYAVFVALGYFLGSAYSSINQYLNDFALVASGIAIVIILVYLWRRKKT